MENQQLINPPNVSSADFTPVNQPVSPPSLVLSVILTALVSAVIFGFGGYYLGRQSSGFQNAPVQTDSPPTPVPATPIPIKNQFLSELLTLLDGFKVIDRDSMWWVSDDNWSVSVKGVESIGMVNAKAYSELGDKNSQTYRLVTTVTGFFKLG